MPCSYLLTEISEDPTCFEIKIPSEDADGSTSESLS